MISKYNTERLDALVMESKSVSSFCNEATKLGLSKTYAKVYYYRRKEVFMQLKELVPSVEKTDIELMIDLLKSKELTLSEFVKEALLRGYVKSRSKAFRVYKAFFSIS
jgi:hypothetical protein